jgi:hypothetical protein
MVGTGAPVASTVKLQLEPSVAVAIAPVMMPALAVAEGS